MTDNQSKRHASRNKRPAKTSLTFMTLGQRCSKVKHGTISIVHIHSVSVSFAEAPITMFINIYVDAPLNAADCGNGSVSIFNLMDLI